MIHMILENQPPIFGEYSGLHKRIAPFENSIDTQQDVLNTRQNYPYPLGSINDFVR